MAAGKFRPAPRLMPARWRPAGAIVATLPMEAAPAGNDPNAPYNPRTQMKKTPRTAADQGNGAAPRRVRQ